MAERAGVVSVDVIPNLQGFGAKVDGFARALKPLAIGPYRHREGGK